MEDIMLATQNLDFTTPVSSKKSLKRPSQTQSSLASIVNSKETSEHSRESEASDISDEILPAPASDPQDPVDQSDITSPTTSPSVISRKSRSRRAQPHSKNPISARRSVGSARRMQQIPDPSAPSSSPLGDDENLLLSPATVDGTARNTPVSTTRRSLRSSRTIRDSENDHNALVSPATYDETPGSTRRSVRSARSISARQMRTLDNQAPPFPLIDGKDAEDELIVVPRRVSSLRGNRRRSSPSHSNSYRNSRRSATLLDDEEATMPEQEGTDMDDDQNVRIASPRGSFRGNRADRRSYRNSRRSVASLNDDAAQDQEGNHETVSTTRDGSSSTRSSISRSARPRRNGSFGSLRVNQTPNSSQPRRSGSFDPKKLHKIQDDAIRTTPMGSRRSTGSEALLEQRPGFIKSFLGTSERALLSGEQVSIDNDAMDDPAE